MLKHDDGDFIVGLVGLMIGLCIIAFIIYVMVLLATVILGVAAAGGTVYGGGTAVKNYFSSFKENVIDSNRGTAAA